MLPRRILGVSGIRRTARYTPAMAFGEHQRAFEDVLAEVGAVARESHLHGLISGYVAARGAAGEPGTLTSLARGIARDAETYGFAREDVPELLGYLIECVETALARDDFSFAPFLADEDEPLAIRVHSVAEWCDGFLSGLASGLDEEEELEGDVLGIVTDLESFADELADSEEGISEDDDERDLTEIEEYLKVAVMMLYEGFGEPDD